MYAALPLPPHTLIQIGEVQVLAVQIASFRHDFVIQRDRQRDVATMASQPRNPSLGQRVGGRVAAPSPARRGPFAERICANAARVIRLDVKR